MKLNRISTLMDDITEHDYCNTRLGEVELKVPTHYFKELLFEYSRGTIVEVDSFVFNTSRGPIIIKKGEQNG